ncbi:MAG: twin-arginine translocase TatA/TatE family subunit [Planctomycetota bacterium]|jgi:sec-independent protein translocase protein TatA
MPFPNLGIGEVLVVLVVALLVFGGKLPEVGRALGRSLVEFKRGLKSLPGSDDTVAGRGDGEAESEEATPGQSP